MAHLTNTNKAKISDSQLDKLHLIKPRGVTIGRWLRDLIDKKIEKYSYSTTGADELKTNIPSNFNK